MLTLSSTGEVCRAIAAARRIDVEAYTLSGGVLQALEAAARRGAEVSVALEGRPYGDSRRGFAAHNNNVAAELRTAGAAATLGHGLHAKKIVADDTLYLDEKNWRDGDLVLRENDPAEARTIPAIKHQALAVEAGLIAGASRADCVIVESESFGCCNAVYARLKDAADSGAAPRLLVSRDDLRGNPKERRAVAQLVEHGVRVRVSRDSEKLAVAGDGAWLGSANATIAAPAEDCTDWGVRTSNAEIVRAVRARLEAQWAQATPL